MKRSIIIQLTSWLLILLIQACNGQPKEEAKEVLNQERNNTTIKSIPLSKRDTSFSKIKKSIENKLGISSIESGFKDLQIRIWKGFAHTDYVQLKVFTKIDTSLSAQLYNLFLHYDKNFDSVVAVTKEVVTKQPRTGWVFFTDSLLKLDILNLPDDSEIPNYNVSMDADAVTVEVASGNKYRVYSYSDVESLSKTIEQAKKMAQILKLIQDEF